MKKLLALVLALVMTLSLCVVSSNAAYTDAADIDFDEAVEVMSAVGVFQGSDGKFDPKANLTREQAAKLVAYLDLGAKVAESLPAVKVFNDVAADRWSAKYVAYCANAGYINGVGGGNFDPTGELTSYAFGKLLLCVLGYDADLEGMTGSSWSINVAKLMEKNELSAGVDKAGAATLTREEAAQFCLNALKADMVDYDSKGISVSGSDINVTVGADKAEPVPYTTKDYDTTNTKTDATKQLVEKLYPDLKLAAAGNDDLGLPNESKWQLKTDTVCEVAKEATFTFTAKTSDKDLAKALNGYKNGATTIKAAGDVTGAFNGTANGKLVVYYADDAKDLTRYEVSYNVGEVTAVSTDKDGNVSYTIAGVTKKDCVDDDNDTIKLEGCTIAKGDIVTYVQGTDYLHVYATTKVVGKQTERTPQTGTMTSIIVDGTSYKASAAALVGGLSATWNNGSKEANYFVDQYGFVVYHSDVEAETVFAVVDRIAFMTTSGTAASQSVEAKLVFTDGSVETVKVAKINGNDTSKAAEVGPASTSPAFAVEEAYASNTALSGKIVSYEVNKDGNYELTYVTASTAVTSATTDKLFTKGVPTIGVATKAATDSKTVFVVKTKDGSKDVFTAYTGYAEVPTVIGALTAQCAKNDVADATVAFVYVDATSATVGDAKDGSFFYSLGKDVTMVGSGSDKYYTLVGILDGAKETIKTKTGTNFNTLATTGLYELTIDDDGYVTAVGAGSKFASGKAADDAKNGVVVIGSTSYAYDDNTVVYVIEDGDVTTGSIASIAKNDNCFVKTVGTTKDAEKATAGIIYVIK